MRLSEKARKDGEREEQEQPRIVHDERGAEREQRDEVLSHGEQHRDQADASGRLAARALQVIVEFGVFELREIQGGGVPHEADADVIGEEIAEQRLHER